MVHPKVLQKDVEFKKGSDSARGAFAALTESGERNELEQNFIRASGGSIEPVGLPEEKKDTYEETLTRIGEGMSLADIAKERGLTLGTIISHIEKLVDMGRLSPKDAAALAPDTVTKGMPDIRKAAGKTGLRALTPVFKKLAGRYTFDELRYARILLKD
jgi:hypothetical protein